MRRRFNLRRRKLSVNYRDTKASGPEVKEPNLDWQAEMAQALLCPVSLSTDLAAAPHDYDSHDLFRPKESVSHASI